MQAVSAIFLVELSQTNHQVEARVRSREGRARVLDGCERGATNLCRMSGPGRSRKTPRRKEEDNTNNY